MLNKLLMSKKKYYIVQVEDANDVELICMKSKIFTSKKEANTFYNLIDKDFLFTNGLLARIVEVDKNGEEDIDDEW